MKTIEMEFTISAKTYALFAHHRRNRDNRDHWYGFERTPDNVFEQCFDRECVWPADDITFKRIAHKTYGDGTPIKMGWFAKITVRHVTSPYSHLTGVKPRTEPDLERISLIQQAISPRDDDEAESIFAFAMTRGPVRPSGKTRKIDNLNYLQNLVTEIATAGHASKYGFDGASALRDDGDLGQRVLEVKRQMYRCTECKREMTPDECGDVPPEELACDKCAGIEPVALCSCGSPADTHAASQEERMQCADCNYATR